MAHIITATTETTLINTPKLQRLLLPEQQRLVARGQSIEIISAQAVGIFIQIEVANPPGPAWRHCWGQSTDFDWGGSLEKTDENIIAITPEETVEMPYLKATQDTWVKKKPEQSSVLLDQQEQTGELLLFQIKAGKQFAVKDALDDVKGHALVDFVAPLTVGKESWEEAYLHMPHWEGFTNLKKIKAAAAHPFSPPGSTLVKQPTPYFVQNDNKDWADDGSASNLRYGGVQCGLTSLSMLLATIWPNDKVEKLRVEAGGQFEDWVAGQLKKHSLQSISGEHHAVLLGKFGIKAKFTSTSTVGELKKALKRHPVILGTLYKDSGHFITATGFDSKTGDILVCDPYGKRALYGSFNQWEAVCATNADTHGKENRYSPSVMDQIWAPHNDGWAVFVDPETPNYGNQKEPIQFSDEAIALAKAESEVSKAEEAHATPSIKAKRATWLKARPVQASQLKDNEKHLLSLDELIDCQVSKADGGHLLITLDTDERLHGRNIWYVYSEHVDVKTPGGISEGTPGGKVTEADIERAAKEIGVEPRAMKAVIAVEAAGSGFFPSGKPKILFEAQWFGLFTDDQYNESHPDISLRAWDPGQYIGGEKEWERLEKAAKLNKEAAYKAASYGLGQIMGFHYEKLGYPSIFDFSGKMHHSEGEQLLAMAKFIALNPAMVKALKTKHWAEFAHAYNGEGYKTNRYDEKLADAYAAAS